MTTKEFRERLEKHGYTFENNFVANDMDAVAYISENNERFLETYTRVSLKTFDLICEYARTPIAERKEQEKYHWQLKTGKTYDGRDDNLFFGYIHPRYIHSPEGWYFTGEKNNAVLKTEFTKAEFEELKERLDIIPSFEPVEID